MRRSWLTLLLALLIVPAVARAQGADRSWQFIAYMDFYLEPGESPFLIPTLFADRGALHLEARYNYEDEETASLWAGRTFAFGGDEDYLKLTPMAGVFFGNAAGIAPGLEVEARWRRLAYWIEAEYTINPGESGDNFFYTWSELNLFLHPSLWLGASAQRLKVIETPREVDVGPMLGFGARGVSLSLYGYGLGTSTPWYLATAAVQF